MRLDATAPAKVPAAARDELDHLAQRAVDEYGPAWSRAGASPVEFTARAFASYLLDAGFSQEHLHRWIRARRGGLTDVAAVAGAVATMFGSMPPKSYETFIPCSAPFDKPTDVGGAARWIDGAEAAAWLAQHVPEPETRRHSGGFLVNVERRDPWAAIDAARELVARADARVRVARASNESIRVDGWARVAENPRDFDVRPKARQVEIGSLHRQDAVYRFDGGLPSATDDVLELASYMESPSAGSAVAGGWAAVEALLIRPGEGSHHLAADRLAALVTCSLPRAEMTTLAYKHMESGATDALAEAIAATTTNFDKVHLIEQHLRDGDRLTLASHSDAAAEARMIEIINHPEVGLGKVHTYVTESVRRLYNQRNTVSHSGSLRSAALNATTRTAFSLVGAGLDRVVHAQLLEPNLDPLALVARAETELRMVGTPGSRSLGALLD